MEKETPNHNRTNRQYYCILQRNNPSRYQNPKDGFIVFGGASIGFASHKTTAPNSRKCHMFT